MARLPRVAASAVLAVALSFGLCASALPAPNSVSSAARLSMARVFDPHSEALISFDTHSAIDMSLLSRVVFNLQMPEAIEIADAVQFVAPDPAPQPAISGASRIVEFTGQEKPAQLAPAPQLTDAPLDVPSTAPYTAISAPAHSPLHPAVSQARAIASVTAPQARFGSYQSYAPSYQGVSAKVDVPVRVGVVKFSGIFGGEQSETTHTDAFRAMQLCGTTDEGAACPYLHDSSARSLVAGTAFDVRAGNRNLNVQLSGTVEQRSNNDAGIFPYVPLDPDTQVGSAHLSSAGPETSMLSYPGLTDVVKHGVDARVAVPITQRLTVGLQYDSAHYQGDYATMMVPGLDARKDTYLGNVTYQLPNTSSAITLSARKYLYQDTFSPNYNLTQTRADLNFTVKF